MDESSILPHRADSGASRGSLVPWVVRKRVFVLPAICVVGALAALAVVSRTPSSPPLRSLESLRAEAFPNASALSALPKGIRRQIVHGEGRELLLAAGWTTAPSGTPECSSRYTVLCQSMPEIRRCLSASDCTAAFLSEDGSTALEIRLFDAATENLSSGGPEQVGGTLHWLGWQRSEALGLSLAAQP